METEETEILKVCGYLIIKRKENKKENELWPTGDVNDDGERKRSYTPFYLFCHWTKQKGILQETCLKLNQ